MSTKKDIEITRGTTNVFTDLGYPDAAERQTKARLALAVNNLLKARKLKQRETAVCCTSLNRRSRRSRTIGWISSRSNAC